MAVYIQTNQSVQLVAPAGAGAYTVNAADTGKTLLIPALGGAGAKTLAVTLPILQSGLTYKFIAQATLASAVTLAPGPAANIICGQIQNQAVATAKANSANVQFTATAVPARTLLRWCQMVCTRIFECSCRACINY